MSAELSNSTPGMAAVSMGSWQNLLLSFLQPKIVVALLTICGSVVFGYGLIKWSANSGLVPLVPGASPQSSGAIIDFLNAKQQPFTVEPSTGMILVPSSKAAELKAAFSGSDIVANSTTEGLEFLRRNQALGTSQFIENARYQHALETELSRTVAKLRNVESARIHLALPRRSSFVRKQGKASASVMVRMNPGRTLESEQVRSIINLVSSSVPYLDTSSVTIVDEWGAMLSSGSETEYTQISNQQFAYARKLEEHHVRRIEDILVPVIGFGRVRVSVSADVDFTMEEATAESFEPDSGQVRSEMENQLRKENANVAGVPGAVTNQPPEGVGPAGEEGADAENISQNLTRNYELDRRISHIKNAPGKVVRLSAAVVLDNFIVPGADVDADTEAQTYSAEEIEQYTALVKEAIGFNEERGDSVMVVASSFQPPEEIEPLPAPSIWDQPMIWTLVRQGGAALIVLILALTIVRPALTSLRGEAVGGGAAKGIENDTEGENDKGSVAGALGVDSDSGVSKAAREAHGDILVMARKMARDDPKRVARVVKDWVEAEAESGGK